MDVSVIELLVFVKNCECNNYGHRGSEQDQSVQRDHHYPCHPYHHFHRLNRCWNIHLNHRLRRVVGIERLFRGVIIRFKFENSFIQSFNIHI